MGASTLPQINKEKFKRPQHITHWTWKHCERYLIMDEIWELNELGMQ